MELWVWSTLLLLLAVLLVLLELVVPSGGVLSLLAALAAVAAIAIGFTDGPRLGATVLGITTILVPLLTAVAVRWWPHTPLGKRVLNRPPYGQQQVLPDGEPYQAIKELVGKRGVAKTKMLPSGAIVLGGRTYDALSEGIPIESGEPIEVVAVRFNHIIVRPADEQPAALEPNSDELLSRPIDTLGLDPFDDPLA